MPSLSYLALRDTDALAVATFLSADRLFYPPGKAQRARLLGRIDALLATSEEVAAAAAERFPGDYTVVPPGVDLKLFRPAKKRKRIVVELVPGEREAARTAIRSLDSLDGWEVVLLRRRARATRPYVPARLRSRVHLRTHPTAGTARRSAECRIRVRACGRRKRPSSAGGGRGRSARGREPTRELREVARELDALYRRLARRRRADPDRERSARRPRLDRLRPPHAHVVVPRLLGRRPGPPRRGRGDRPRRDRRHGPQRLRRRPRGGRAREGESADRDRRRGGEDEGPGRGDRALPPRGDPARDDLRGHDRRHPRAERPRLPPPPLRSPTRDPRSRDAAPASRGDRRARGLQRTPAARTRTTTRRCASRGSTTSCRARARTRTSSPASARAPSACVRSRHPRSS